MKPRPGGKIPCWNQTCLVSKCKQRREIPQVHDQALRGGNHGASPTQGGAVPNLRLPRLIQQGIFWQMAVDASIVIKSGTLGSYYDRGESWQSGFVWIFSGCYGLLVTLSSKVISPQLKRWGQNGSHQPQLHRQQCVHRVQKRESRGLGAKSTPSRWGQDAFSSKHTWAPLYRSYRVWWLIIANLATSLGRPTSGHIKEEFSRRC